jgi:hypothetical protein
MQGTGAQTWARLRDGVEASMTAPSTIDEKTECLLIIRVRAGFSDGDADERRHCLSAVIEADQRVGTMFAACLSGITGKALEMARLRGFGCMLDWILFTSSKGRITSDAPHAAIWGTQPAFQRFQKTNARLPGRKNGFCDCDISAPMGNAGQFTLSEVRRFFDWPFPALTRNAPPLRTPRLRKPDRRPAPAGKQGGDLLPRPGKSNFAQHRRRVFGRRSLVHELGHAWHDRRTFRLPRLLRTRPRSGIHVLRNAGLQARAEERGALRCGADHRGHLQPLSV